MESDCCDQESSSPRWESSRWVRAHPADAGLGPLVSQLVSSLLSCKFCTKNCYFSLFFFFCRWWFCCGLFFFFPFTPRPLCLRLSPGFKAHEISGIKTQSGDLGIAVDFSSICGLLPTCATEEIFIFHMRKCVVRRDSWFKLLVQPPRGCLRSVPTLHKRSGGWYGETRGWGQP